jgi:esterase/lipase
MWATQPNYSPQQLASIRAPALVIDGEHDEIVKRSYTELLRAAGVDSVKELAQRRADHLHEKVTAINREKKHVREVPGVNTIERWIEEAKALPGIVTY